MQIKKTIGYGQSADVATEETTSAYSTDLTVGPQSNIRMVQNVRLIWLDQSIDENNADCRNTIGQLRRVVHTINTCTDIDTCLQFLQDTNEEKACLIVSGSLGNILYLEYIICSKSIPYLFSVATKNIINNGLQNGQK